MGKFFLFLIDKVGKFVVCKEARVGEEVNLNKKIKERVVQDTFRKAYLDVKKTSRDKETGNRYSFDITKLKVEAALPSAIFLYCSGISVSQTIVHTCGRCIEN